MRPAEPAAVLPARQIALVEAMNVAAAPVVVALFETALVVPVAAVVAPILGQRRRHTTQHDGGRRHQAKQISGHAYLQ